MTARAEPEAKAPRSAPAPSEQQYYADVALEVAGLAGALTLQGFRKSFEVSTKAQEELFTEYDVRSEELVRHELQARTPTLAVVGEEQGGAPGEGLTWYVDPIDGTVNFIAGSPWYCVSIGLMFGRRPLAGAVVAPALGIAWHGSVGGGVFRNGEACRVSPTSRLADSLIATGYPGRRGASGLNPRTESFRRLLQASREVRRCGSSAVELCMVADGTFEAYWMRHLNDWDTSAGAAMVVGAGGTWRILSSTGESPSDFQDIAANGAVDDELFSTLNGSD